MTVNERRAVILTALEVEYRAVRSHLRDVNEEVFKGTIYEVGLFEEDGQEWLVAILQVGMGGERAARETERALTYFEPDIALFVGVAGGIKDLKLGDVVAATKVYAYEHGKAGDTFKPRPEVGLASYTLEQRAKKVALDRHWLARIDRVRKRRSPTAKVAPIAAGSKVVSSNQSETATFIRESYSDATAVEMEGHGFLEAVRASSGVDALVVRGISDLIDKKAESDGDGWQEFASMNAAAFAFEILARLRIEPTDTTRRPSRGSAIRAQGSSKESHATTLPTEIVGSFVPARSRSFAGRTQELSTLYTLLTSNGESTPSVVVIHGLSGMGKTQLCREFIDRHRHEYAFVAWINAQNESTLDSEIAHIAKVIQIPGYKEDDLLESSKATISWLEQQGNWLLILDGASPESIGRSLPSKGNGHILLTSNSPHWSSITSSALPLEGLSEEDAVSLLIQRSGDTNVDSARKIARSFDRLPLALEQAAAYLETTRCGLHEYEYLLNTHRPVLLEEKSPFSDYSESVYSAIRLNIEKVAERLDHSLSILHFCAFTYPTSIPRWLIRTSSQEYFSQNEIEFNDIVFNRMIATLSSFSLIRAEIDTVTIHPLVQAFTRDEMTDEERLSWSRFVVSTIAYLFPLEVADSSTWPQCEELLNHAMTSLEHTGYSMWDDDYVKVIYSHVGAYLHIRGREEPALFYEMKDLEFSRDDFGEDHPKTALAHNNLIDTLCELGRVNEALYHGERAVSILTSDESIQQDYAVDLGIVYSNIGRLYGFYIRDYEIAKSYFNRAIEIHRRELGDYHFTTAIDVNNLGTVFREEKNWNRAYAIFSDSVQRHRAVLDRDDSRLSIALFNLGTAAYNVGRLYEAEAVLSEAVRINDVLGGGAEPHDQMDALFGLAKTLKDRGKITESIQYFDRSMEIALRLVGDRAPKTRQIRRERGYAIARTAPIWKATHSQPSTVLSLVQMHEHMDKLSKRPIQYYPNTATHDEDSERLHRFHLVFRINQS